MPTRYTERLNLPLDGNDSIRFSTTNGLLVAIGYERVIFSDKGPYVEFTEDQLNKENIYIPPGQKWRASNKASSYIEYRSRDYCNVKIIQQKSDDGDMKRDMYYISPFNLRSDKVPVLIQSLRRKHTLQIA